MPRIIFSLVLLWLCYNAHGQVIFGPELGIGLGTTSYADPSDPAPLTRSFTKTFGLSVWSVFPSRVNIMFAIRYAEACNRLSGKYDNGTVQRELENTYVSMPLRITFSLATFGNQNSLHAYLGPEVAYWTSAKLSIHDINSGDALLNDRFAFNTHDANDNIVNRLQYGYQAGLTLLIQRGISNWAVSIQYSQGMSKQGFGVMTYQSIPGFQDDISFRRQSLMLVGTYYLDLKSRKKGRSRNKHIRPNWRNDL